MIRRRRRKRDDTVEMQMGPMIDMVFLLLVFFMVSAKPVKEESDIQIALPGKQEQSEAVDIPDEQRILINTDGTVVLNDMVLAAAGDSAMKDLVVTMKRFKESSEANKSKALVTIAPEENVPHQRVVDVLNACAAAEIKGVTFDTQSATGGGDEF
ncbi:MAG: biopolymer transporter ExbD [Verrucomicrobiales bacterium]|nr:biopolymer transporter ExbD [Verrucomicrobiales bacterium]